MSNEENSYNDRVILSKTDVLIIYNISRLQNETKYNYSRGGIVSVSITYEDLAHETGVTIATMVDGVRRLVDEGVLIVERPDWRYNNTRNGYRLDFERLQECEAWEKKRGFKLGNASRLEEIKERGPTYGASRVLAHKRKSGFYTKRPGVVNHNLLRRRNAYLAKRKEHLEAQKKSPDAQTQLPPTGVSYNHKGEKLNAFSPFYSRTDIQQGTNEKKGDYIYRMANYSLAIYCNANQSVAVCKAPSWLAAYLGVVIRDNLLSLENGGLENFLLWCKKQKWIKNDWRKIFSFRTLRIYHLRVISHMTNIAEKAADTLLPSIRAYLSRCQMREWKPRQDIIGYLAGVFRKPDNDDEHESIHPSYTGYVGGKGLCAKEREKEIEEAKEKPFDFSSLLKDLRENKEKERREICQRLASTDAYASERVAVTPTHYR